MLTGFNISKELLEWMKDNLSGNLLELGSGLGTKYLCDHFNIVYSIEDNPDYQNLYHDNYINVSIKDDWYNVEELAPQLLGKKYNAILVDAPLGSIGRKGFLKHLNLFNTDVPIIIDDTHRIKELNLFKDLKKKLPNKKVIHITSKEKKASILC